LETLTIRKIFNQNVGYVDVADPRSQVGGVVVKFEEPIIPETSTAAIRANCHLDHNSETFAGRCPALSNGIYCHAITFLFSCRGLVAWKGGPIACGKAPDLEEKLVSLTL